MVQYQCARCGYKSSSKHNTKRHILGKKKCSPDLEDIIATIEGMKILVEGFNCDFCNKSYKTKASLKRHQSNSCKTKVSKLEIENARLLEKLKEAESKSTTINNNTINIQVNLNGYRQTSFDHLTDRNYQNAIRRMIYSVPQLIKDVHFNKDAPENHNIYISNIKNKYAMVWDGEQWCAKDQDQVINDLINDQEYAIEEWLGEGERFPKEMKKFNEYLEKKENDEVTGIVKEEVKLLLYNNRKLFTK